MSKVFTLSNLVLLTALTLSTIAAWYSILGLTAIFAAAVIPIIIMGVSLEIAKVVATVWLHRYWKRASFVLKLYLVPAVATLALITSMGIFGFLSKAHLDQTVPTSDVAAQVSLLDEKVKTQQDNIQVQRDNITAARSALTQLDSQVNARLDRGTSEQSAERSVQIRRQQSRERQALNNEIQQSQSEIEKINEKIAQLNEQRAPVASQLRKVQAEVGPIKYIANLIYGQSTDEATLEKAVTWIIILLVLVFDPLALCLVIAAITSRKWEHEGTYENFNNLGYRDFEVVDSTPEEESTIEKDEIIEDTSIPPVVPAVSPTPLKKSLRQKSKKSKQTSNEKDGKKSKKVKKTPKKMLQTNKKRKSVRFR
jgi:hypothetical protein